MAHSHAGTPSTVVFTVGFGDVTPAASGASQPWGELVAVLDEAQDLRLEARVVLRRRVRGIRGVRRGLVGAVELGPQRRDGDAGTPAAGAAGLPRIGLTGTQMPLSSCC